MLAMLCPTLVQGIDDIPDQQSLREWQAFYQKYFRMDLDISGILVPEQQEGFDRIIVVAGGLTHQAVIEVMREHFEMVCVNAYLTNFYDHQTYSVRNNDQTYAIRVRNTEISGEYKKMATAVEKTSAVNTGLVINDMTLLERLIYELKYYDETGGHLDVEGFTVCGGSYFKKDSLVLSPAVGWKTGRGAYYPPFLFISECYKAFTQDGLYSRHVITLLVQPGAAEPPDPPAWYEFHFKTDDQP